MTGNEILKASMLDLLFENRNKMYGAYVLRRGYNQRLITALGTTVVVMLLISFSIRPGGSNESSSIGILDSFVLLSPVDVAPEKQKPPVEAAAPKPKVQAATNKYVSTIDIVSNIDETDVPTTDDLSNTQIGTSKMDGELGDENVMRTQITGTGENGIEKIKDEGNNFEKIEKAPEFPGGSAAWLNFLSRYPRTPGELDAGERRTVHIRFLVSADGSITNFEIVQSGGEAFDNEVIRVLKKMPKWKPAVQNGHHVATTFTQPVTFQAVEE